MTQYILLIQSNSSSEANAQEWEDFSSAAQDSGFFRGGSAIGSREVLGNTHTAKSTAHIDGFMRFDSADKAALLELLEKHPVVMHGGAVELCEMPKS